MIKRLELTPITRTELVQRRLQEQAERVMKRGEDGIKRRVAVPSPQGGYRMEVRIIKAHS